jgi:hypothetical protein
MATGVGDDQWWWRRGGQAAAVVTRWVFPSLRAPCESVPLRLGHTLVNLGFECLL